MSGVYQLSEFSSDPNNWLPPGLQPKDWQRAISAPLFADLPSEVVLNALRAGHLKCFDSGQKIFCPSNRPKTFFLVLQGRVKLYFLDRDGEERGSRFIGCGELVCPRMVKDDATSESCTFAEAAETLRLLALPDESFLNLLRNHFCLATNIIAHLATSLERADHQASLRKVRCATVLVARFLLERSQNQGVPIDLSPIRRTAQELGIARETLSRIMTRMHQDQLITYHKGRVIDLDHSGLQEQAGL